MIARDERPIVFIIHTVQVSVKELTDLFAELAPEAKVFHIIDDSLLAEVVRVGAVTPGVRERMCSYFVAAEKAGADLIFNQCSSVGEVAELAQHLVGVPMLRVDLRMAETACRMGSRIAVAATLPTTLGPTCRLVQRAADAQGRKIEIVDCLAEGAFDRLMAGDRLGHNRLVIDAIKSVGDDVDVIVCAQGSMTALLDDLAKESIKAPVLTSLRLGVENAAELLRDMPRAAHAA